MNEGQLMGPAARPLNGCNGRISAKRICLYSAFIVRLRMAYAVREEEPNFMTKFMTECHFRQKLQYYQWS